MKLVAVRYKLEEPSTRCADSGPWSPGYDDRAVAGWCARQRLALTGEPQKHGVRCFGTAHSLYPAKICYRYHPCHGVEVERIRYLLPPRWSRISNALKRLGFRSD